jgi:aminobenzoyl-glutamate transport protein
LPAPAAAAPAPSNRFVDRFLNGVERVGNKLPDPAVLFLIALGLVWVASAIFAQVQFADIDPRTGKPIEIRNQLTGASLATFLAGMVGTFTSFPPLGVVLVALLGVGVAEHTGFINAGLRALLGITPRMLLTPMLILVAILSHTAADAGYVLVIPLGGVIFAAAGRNPLAGIGAAFAGVSGGFGANFIPSGIDPLLQGFTQSAAQIIDPTRLVNPLCNWWFTAASSVLIVALGWFITDKIVEPRLAGVKLDGDGKDMPTMDRLSPAERRGLWAGIIVMLAGLAVLVAVSLPGDSALRGAERVLAPGEPPVRSLTTFDAPLMKSIVPLIFLLFILPGIVYGYAARTVKGHRDIIAGMSKSMSTMGYYLVLVFFAALFTYAFAQSNMGALLALKGASAIKAMALPGGVTVVLIILTVAGVNLLVGSASAKWALLGPIFVPMLMQLGLSPELTQAAYRVGDSTTNIITPLMPYFPLVVVYCQRYLKNTGIGTLVSMMLPYSLSFLGAWVLFLLGYWALGLPLGIQAEYTYP